MVSTPRTKETWLAISDEIMSQTDRGAGIIAASVLEEALTDALKARLILSTSVEEKIFSLDRRGIASEFGAKIDLAFCTGLIHKAIYDELRLIAKIRNRFAHLVEPISFSEPNIKGWCQSLKSSSEKFESPRLAYLSACNMLTVRFVVIFATDGLRIKSIREDATLSAAIEATVDAILLDDAPRT